MILASEHSQIGHGTRVESSVALAIEDVGVKECPFTVTLSVNHVRMVTTRLATEADAKKERELMHASYWAACSPVYRLGARHDYKANQ